MISARISLTIVLSLGVHCKWLICKNIATHIYTTHRPTYNILKYGYLRGYLNPADIAEAHHNAQIGAGAIQPLSHQWAEWHISREGPSNNILIYTDRRPPRLVTPLVPKKRKLPVLAVLHVLPLPFNINTICNSRGGRPA